MGFWISILFLAACFPSALWGAGSLEFPHEKSLRADSRACAKHLYQRGLGDILRDDLSEFLAWADDLPEGDAGDAKMFERVRSLFFTRDEVRTAFHASQNPLVRVLLTARFPKAFEDPDVEFRKLYREILVKYAGRRDCGARSLLAIIELEKNGDREDLKVLRDLRRRVRNPTMQLRLAHAAEFVANRIGIAEDADVVDFGDTIFGRWVSDTLDELPQKHSHEKEQEFLHAFVVDAPFLLAEDLTAAIEMAWEKDRPFAAIVLIKAVQTMKKPLVLSAVTSDRLLNFARAVARENYVVTNPLSIPESVFHLLRQYGDDQDRIDLGVE